MGNFFCAAVAEPQGDLGFLEQSMAAMNAECPQVGKMLFSDGTDQLSILAYVPDVLTSVMDCEAWLQAVKHAIGGTVVESTGTYGKLVVRAGADVYPIKQKDPGITAAIGFLKEN